MNKKVVVHVYNGLFLAHKKKNELLPFTTAWMGLEGIMLRELDRKRQIPYDFTYMWNLKNKNKKNEQTK